MGAMVFTLEMEDANSDYHRTTTARYFMDRLIPSYYGAVAGAFSAFVFMIIHDIFISDIWSMAFIMIIAGVICGLLVLWSYNRVVAAPSTKSWLGYNALYLAGIEAEQLVV